MEQTVMINDMEINAYNVQIDAITANGQTLTKLGIDFKVTHDMYHDVTTLLYENDFMVNVPDKHLAFQAVITQYSTSITNLYESGNVGEFRLELTEKGSKR